MFSATADQPPKKSKCYFTDPSFVTCTVREMKANEPSTKPNDFNTDTENQQLLKKFQGIDSVIAEDLPTLFNRMKCMKKTQGDYDV